MPEAQSIDAADRPDDMAPALPQGKRRIVDKKWDIGAYLRGARGQFIQTQAQLPQLIQSQENACGITGAAAQARTDRDALDYLYAYALIEAVFAAQQKSAFMTEVGFVERDARIFTADVDAAFLVFQDDLIGKIDSFKYGGEVMEPVGTPPDDLKV